MDDKCERCGLHPAAFIAVSTDYKRKLEVCDECFIPLSEEGGWFFAPATPEVSERTDSAALRHSA
ncbi:MAG: hypothetical protein WEB00_10640 [Dehalococcoidia bacterium]